MKNFFFISFVLIQLSAIASIPDSLIIEANKESDKEKRIDHLNKAGMDYAVINIAKSDSVLNTALKEAKEINYEYGIAMAYNNIGEMYFHAGKYDTAIVFLEKALPIRNKINDNKGLGNT